MAIMSSQPNSFVDADGVTVTYRQWNAADPRGAVVVAHGASEHSGRYDRFARALTAQNWAVFAPDHRGHGRPAPAAVIGPRGMDGVLDDLDEIVLMAREIGGPVVLFGHSMGSVIALRYAEARDGRLAALVLSGPLGVLPGADTIAAQLQGVVDAGQGDEPVDALGAFNASFEPARTPYDWLSRDDAEVDTYLADPLCGDDLPLSNGWVLATFGGAHEGGENVASIPKGLPVLIAAGSRDPVSNFTENTRELARRMSAQGITVTEKYYQDARHEILNETNRDEVTADIIEWLNGVV